MALTVLSVAYPFAPVGPDAVGGAEQVLSALDRALVARGERSIVIACEGSSTAGRLVATAPVPGRISNEIRRHAWCAHRQAIEGVLREEKVDLVHLHGIDFDRYIPEGVPVLATLHLPLDWYSAAIFEPRPSLFLHCVSEAQHAGRPTGGRLLPPVPNGVPSRLFETRQRKRSFALMLARICPEKGVDIALEASRIADFPLLIGGAAFPYEAHRRYFEERVAPFLDAGRRFLGPVGFERKRRLLAAARCVLIPSLVAETSSLAALEALASGTPVIAFPNGALPSLIKDGVNGFIVRNAAEMAQAIAAAEALSPDDCRFSVIDRAEERMVDRYLDHYRTIAPHAIRSVWPRNQQGGGSTLSGRVPLRQT